MSINIDNKLFNHFFITIDNVLINDINFVKIGCNSIKSNLFIYITTKKYLSDKFYEIGINTNILKYLITDYV